MEGGRHFADIRISGRPHVEHSRNHHTRDYGEHQVPWKRGTLLFRSHFLEGTDSSDSEEKTPVESCEVCGAETGTMSDSDSGSSRFSRNTERTSSQRFWLTGSGGGPGSASSSCTAEGPRAT